MDTLILLVTIILPLLLGYILGRNRDNSKILFIKKLTIYSDIIYEINAHKYLYDKIKSDERKLNKLIELKQKLDLDEKLVQENEFELFEEINLLEKNKSSLNYKDNLIRLFAPARLLGSRRVVEELREYFSLVSEYYNTEYESEKEKITNKISASVMELEQLMRKDLGRFRLHSKIDLWWHHYINKS